MTDQLELPFFTRSTADNPLPEQDHTHPAEIIIRHCGKSRKHVAHAFKDDFPFGCPGTPDLRDTATVVEDARRALDRQQAVRDMDLRSFRCHEQREFHSPHEVGGVHCPGLATRHCNSTTPHAHHRWWIIPDAFYWCDGEPTLTFRAIEDVELP